MSEPLVHLICGSTGAGKSTYALKLCRHRRGLFLHRRMDGGAILDAPAPIDSDWALARVERCMFVEATWRAPDADEMTRYNGVRIA